MSGVLFIVFSPRASWAGETWQLWGSGVKTGQVRLFPWSLGTSLTQFRLMFRLYGTNYFTEWQVIDTALHAYSMVGVSLYDTLGKDAVGTSDVIYQIYCSLIFVIFRIHVRARTFVKFFYYVNPYRTCSINHSHITVVFVTAQHLSTLLSLAPKAPMLKMVVSIDSLSPETRKVVSAWGSTVGVDVRELGECE